MYSRYNKNNITVVQFKINVLRKNSILKDKKDLVSSSYFASPFYNINKKHNFSPMTYDFNAKKGETEKLSEYLEYLGHEKEYDDRVANYYLVKDDMMWIEPICDIGSDYGKDHYTITQNFHEEDMIGSYLGEIWNDVKDKFDHLLFNQKNNKTYKNDGATIQEALFIETQVSYDYEGDCDVYYSYCGIFDIMKAIENNGNDIKSLLEERMKKEDEAFMEYYDKHPQ